MVEAALELDVRMEFMGEFQRYVETKAGAICFTNPIIFATVKLIKDFTLLAAANTYPSVFDSKFNGIFSTLRHNRHAAMFGIFEGVGNEILKQLFEVQAADGYGAEFGA